MGNNNSSSGDGGGLQILNPLVAPHFWSTPYFLSNKSIYLFMAYV
jgi:hypothetical protein